MDIDADPIELPAGRAAHGGVEAPASKSHAIRALVCAALASGPSLLRGLPEADDVRAAVAALTGLGIRVDAEALGARIHGHSGRIPRSAGVRLDLAGSATALRFLAAVAALGPGPTTLTGDDSLRRRPMESTVLPLRDLGVTATTSGEGGAALAPLVVAGGPPRRDRVSVDASSSSHPLSALLLMGPALPRGLCVRPRGAVASRPYVDLTIWTMARFGARVLREGETFRVAPGGYVPADIFIVGDWSSAAFLMGAAAVTEGDVSVAGLEWESPQADRHVVEILRAFGATVDRTKDGVRVRGGDRRPLDLNLRDTPDLAPLVAALGCLAKGTTRVRGAAHLRHKESDRIATVVAAARALGCQAAELPDGFEITGPAHRGGLVATQGDHRIAMAFAVAGLAIPGVRIDDRACVAKSYPAFWGDLGLLTVS